LVKVNIVVIVIVCVLMVVADFSTRGDGKDSTAMWSDYCYWWFV